MIAFGNNDQDSETDSDGDDPIQLGGGGGVALDLKNMYSDWQIGKDFTLGRKLGSGIYGTVMEAYHIPSQKNVAIKRFD